MKEHSPSPIKIYSEMSISYVKRTHWYLDCLVLKLEGLYEIVKLMLVTFFKNTIHVHACRSIKELNYAIIIKSRKHHVGNYA